MKVAMIDDSKAERFLFRHIFKDKNVTMFDSIQSALALKERYDVVIIDYSVIRDYGIKEFSKIKQKFKAPIVFTSNAFPFLNISDVGASYIGKEHIKDYILNDCRGRS